MTSEWTDGNMGPDKRRHFELAITVTTTLDHVLGSIKGIDSFCLSSLGYFYLSMRLTLIACCVPADFCVITQPWPVVAKRLTCCTWAAFSWSTRSKNWICTYLEHRQTGTECTDVGNKFKCMHTEISLAVYADNPKAYYYHFILRLYSLKTIVYCNYYNPNKPFFIIFD